MTSNPCIPTVPGTVSIVNDGNPYRYIARDPSGVFYHAVQGGMAGDTVDYVRVDYFGDIEELTIHEVTELLPNESFIFNPEPVNIGVTYT